MVVITAAAENTKAMCRAVISRVGGIPNIAAPVAILDKGVPVTRRCLLGHSQRRSHAYDNVRLRKVPLSPT